MTRIKEPIFITSLIEVEVLNAIQLRVFRRNVTAQGANTAKLAFEQDVVSGVVGVHPLPVATFEIAKRLSSKHTATLGTRGFDLVHVAAALALDATAFLSFDQNQRKLAQAAGLTLQPRSLAHLQ